MSHNIVWIKGFHDKIKKRISSHQDGIQSSHWLSSVYIIKSHSIVQAQNAKEHTVLFRHLIMAIKVYKMVREESGKKEEYGLKDPAMHIKSTESLFFFFFLLYFILNISLHKHMRYNTHYIEQRVIQ